MLHDLLALQLRGLFLSVMDISEFDLRSFLSPDALFKAGNRSDLCLACFCGTYPTELYDSIENANKDGKF